jgi:hypothetical protein
LLSNIRWYPEKREIGHIFVDREDPEICRVEGRWRLEGSPPEPKLVFWRETKDCDGTTGWAVIVGDSRPSSDPSARSRTPQPA